jgi:hypothetical protein
MATQRRLKMINFDLSIKRLDEEFGEGKHRKGYSCGSEIVLRD